MITNIKKRADHRAKIIVGQLAALQEAIADEKYCVDIMTQSLAIQRALSSLNKLVLENHLQTCAREKLKSSSETTRNKAIDELLDLYELSRIRSK